jgi:hypothetical protein
LKIRVVFFLSLVTIMLAVSGLASNGPGDIVSSRQQVAKAAGQALSEWLAKIPMGQEAGYGFSGRADFERASAGVPVRMATVSPKSFTADAGRDSAKIELLDVYRVPVLVDGRYRALLTVDCAGGHCEVVEIGAARLARELEDFMRQGIAEDSGQQVFLLRLFQLHSDLLLVSANTAKPEAGRIYPLQSARMFLKLGTMATIDWSRLVEIIERRFRAVSDNSRGVRP